MTDKEEEQLLEDASTLLMFASAVARRRTPDSPASATKNDLPAIKSRSQSPRVPGPRPGPETAPVAPLHAATAPKPHLAPMLPLSNPPMPFASTGKDGASPPHLEAVAGPPKPNLPHPHGGQIAFLAGLPPANYPYYQYGYPQGQPPQLGPPLRYAPGPPGILPPAMSPLAAQPAAPPPQVLYQPELAPKQPASKPYLSSPETKTQLPRQGGLPAQGSFQTHRRTASGGHQPLAASNLPSLSPGPGNKALSRGINVETGKRNTDNAMIAAAALAAAADIPLPLKNKDAPVHDKEMPESLELKSPPLIVRSTPGIKAEDSVLTEMEDDENRTEEEPILETRDVPESTAVAQPTQLEVSAPKVADVATPKIDQETKAAPVTENTPPGTNLHPIAPTIPTTTQVKIASADEQHQPLPSHKDATPEATEEAFAPPQLDEFKVDPDSGIIGCICGIEEDDGFTIQCDVCYRWQHCSCMGYKTNEEVPEDEYKCYYCDKTKWNKFDPEVCKADTMARLDLDRFNEPDIKPAPPKRKSLSNGGEDKKRRKSEKEIKTSERPSTEKRKSSAAAVNVSPQIPAPTAPIEINNKDNPLLEDGLSAELYQGVYYKLTDNDYKTVEVRRKLTELGSEFETSEKKSTDGITSIPLAAYKAIKFSKVILPSYQKHLQERNELRRGKDYNETAIQVKLYSDNPKQKFVGISKFGLFISKRAESDDDKIVPSGTAVAEYLGEVDFLELYMSNLANQYSIWGTVKPHVARVDLHLQEEGSPLSIVLDSRFVGNEARFVRKSCPISANCEIRTFYIPELQAFKHVIYTTKNITLKGENLEEELRLKWEWDEKHPIERMFAYNTEGLPVEGMKFEDFTDEEKVLLVSGVDNILNFVECACNTTSINLQCAIFKIKKATSYLLRSTRKASSLTNIAFNKSKEELVMPKKKKQYVSWKERLSERDRLLHMSIFSIGNMNDSTETLADGEDGSATDLVDRTSDAENEQTNEIAEKIKQLQKLPYRQHLIAQGRKFASRRYVVDNGDSPANEASHVPKTIPVPLMSDIYVSIKESVNETIKPLAKIASSGNIVANPAEIPHIGSELETTQPTWKESTPPIGLEPKEVPAVESKRAPLVKKLSFADYKKKMK